MKYSLIAVDMDGTFLTSESTISERNLAAVHDAVSSRMKVVIATGRPIQGVRKYLSQLDLHGPVITYNGAVIADSDTEEILYEVSMSRKDAELSLRLGDEYDTTMCIWSKGQLYTNKLNDRAYDYMKISGVEPVLLTDYSEILDRGITKILWYDDVEMISRMPSEMATKEFTETEFCLSRPYFLEFFSSKASKANAIAKLCEMYGISPAEVVAFGDAPNDIPMLRFAGMGVAMSNALPEVIAVADYVAPSNDEDGVAQVIEELLQNN